MVFVTDNMTVRAGSRCVNKVIMHWVKQLFWLSCEFNFEIQSIYLKSGFGLWFTKQVMGPT